MLFSTDKHLSINGRISINSLDLRSQLTKNKEIKVIEQLENNAKKLDEMEVSLENGHKQHTMILDEVNSFGKQLNSMNDSLKVLEQSVTDQITKTLRGYNEEMLSVKNQLMQIDQKLIITGEELITHFGQFEMLRRDIDNFKTDYNIYREITIKIEEGGIMKNDYLKDISKYIIKIWKSIILFVNKIWSKSFFERKNFKTIYLFIILLIFNALCNFIFDKIFF